MANEKLSIFTFMSIKESFRRVIWRIYQSWGYDQLLWWCVQTSSSVFRCSKLVYGAFAHNIIYFGLPTLCPGFLANCYMVLRRPSMISFNNTLSSKSILFTSRVTICSSKNFYTVTGTLKNNIYNLRPNEEWCGRLAEYSNGIIFCLNSGMSLMSTQYWACSKHPI